MKKTALMGAIALALTSSFSIVGASGAAAQTVTVRGGGIVITEAHIAYIRQALALTPAQQPYWEPVETALRALAQSQAQSGGGLVGLAGTAESLRKITAIATPLVRLLHPAQKRNAIVAARAMGFGHLAAAL
jgi:hypothetical protein